MSISKSELLKTLKAVKTRQDEVNDGKFVAQESGKSLMSTAEHTKLDGIATGAQVNVIESISIDGTAQTIAEKGVALDLTAYAKKADVASALQYRGTVQTYTSLTTIENPATGDVYNITKAGGTDANGTAIKAGDNVAYNGSGWDVLAGTTDLSAYYTSAQVDNLFTDAVETVTEEDIAGIFAEDEGGE